MRNIGLYEILKKYCQDVTILFKEHIQDSDLPVRSEERFEMTGPTSFRSDTVQSIDWLSLVLGSEEFLGQMDVHRQALQALAEDPVIAKHLNTLVGISGTGRRIEAGECLRWLVTRLLAAQQGFDFQEETFQKVYSGFEEFFYRDTLDYRIICPLQSFKMQSERLDLTPNLSIIRISGEDKERMLSLCQNGGGLSKFLRSGLPAEYMLELQVEIPKAVGITPGGPVKDTPSESARRTFDEVCTALRLFKRGAVCYSQYWIEPASWNVLGTSGIEPFLAGHVYGTTYTLLDEDIPAFLLLWRSPLRSLLEKHKSIAIAFDRLGFGYERRRPEDRLIDFTIGLEALLLENEAELSYRLALRAAALLGSTPENRETIYYELRKAYDQRSKIAHGNSPTPMITVEGASIPFNELVNRAEEHLRSAIKECLNRCQHQNKNRMIEALDRNLVRGFTAAENS